MVDGVVEGRDGSDPAAPGEHADGGALTRFAKFPQRCDGSTRAMKNEVREENGQQTAAVASAVATVVDTVGIDEISAADRPN